MNNQRQLLVTVVLIMLFVSFLTRAVRAYDVIENGSVAMIFGEGLVLGDDDKEDHEDEDKDEQEQEQEHEEEDKEDDSFHSEEQIKNSNGTTTYIKRETESGKDKVELKTYDASGKLIEERKLSQEDSDDGSREFELENYVYNNGDLQELKIKNKEGKELEISIKEGVTKGASSRVQYEVAEQQLKIKPSGSNREIFITPKDNYFEVYDGASTAKVELPISINSSTGEVFIETIVGLVRVGISPQKALEIAQDSNGSIHDENEIKLVEGGNGLEYKVSTQKQEKLLGLIMVPVDVEYTVDAETGEYTGVNQGFWTKILDLMSFSV